MTEPEGNASFHEMLALRRACVSNLVHPLLLGCLGLHRQAPCSRLGLCSRVSCWCEQAPSVPSVFLNSQPQRVPLLPAPLETAPRQRLPR